MKSFLLYIAFAGCMALVAFSPEQQQDSQRNKSRKARQQYTDTQSDTRIPRSNDPELHRRDTPPIPTPPPPVPRPDTIRKY